MKLSVLLAEVTVPPARLIKSVADPEINRVVEDSRQVRPGDLFVARSGTRHRGESFIQDALGRGAAAVLLAEAASPAAGEGRDISGEEMLARLAHRLRGDPARDLTIFAVTGTNGKTTISYLVRAICKAAGRRCGLISTVEIDDGAQVRESVMTTPGPVELADLFAEMKSNGVRTVSMEASSHALDQGRMAGFQVAAAMFSNLTGDHLDYHKTMENYASAKARLFASLSADSWAIVNADDPWSSRMIQGCRARVLHYGLDKPADFKADILRMDAMGTTLRISHPGGSPWTIRTELVGRHNVLNILCAVAACVSQGLAAPAIQLGLEQMRAVPGRLEAVLVEGKNRQELPFQVLVDYAHTHDALENVLRAIRPWTKGRIICVFGCGGDRDATKRPKMAAVAQRLADQIIITNDNPRTEDPQSIVAMILAGFSTEGRTGVRVCPDRRAAIQAAIEEARAGDVVLIAGKGHERYQILGTVKHPFDDVAVARAALAERWTAVEGAEVAT
jgi:UDP-N-acetylmuramoyl-L-alanyl-D-glutamate--2,6-diaminopimelate ligase